MQIALLQSLPFVPVEPYAFAPFAMIQRKGKTPPNQELDHAETTFRTIYRKTGFRQREALRVMQSLGQIRAVVLNPLPILRAADPIAAPSRAIQRREILV